MAHRSLIGPNKQAVQPVQPVYSRRPKHRYIKILTILPGRFGDITQCKLEIVNLDNKPLYKALSYLWGATSPPAKIQCDNQIPEVTPNLGGSLQRLRYLHNSGISEAGSPLSPSNDGRLPDCKRIWIHAFFIN
jgi:hypothetical protein